MRGRFLSLARPDAAGPVAAAAAATVATASDAAVIPASPDRVLLSVNARCNAVQLSEVRTYISRDIVIQSTCIMRGSVGRTASIARLVIACRLFASGFFLR